MRRIFTQSKKMVALAAGLFATGLAAQAAVYEVGQTVTEFITNEEAGIPSAMAFTTADSLANWAYGSYNDGNVLAYNDQRGWRGVFAVNAPADGKYGVAVKVRTTTTNWMMALTASSTLELAERVNLDVAPAWGDMLRPTLISTLKTDTIVVEEAVGEPDTEEYIPAITELRHSFASGEWETVYMPVDLKAGQNYVTFWLCRTYQGIDNLKGPDGTVNGLFVESIKVLPQGSGEVAGVLQKATLKLWQQRMYPAMNSEEGAALAADYAALHTAYGAATSYSGLDTTKVHAGIEAVAARENDLRHGKGVIVEGDSAVFALPYYHSVSAAISENERGEYPDAPMVFEYTNGKTIVYKFTMATDGDFYPELYYGTASSTKAHINIYAADSTTKAINTWSFDPNTGNWQVYKMWSSPNTTTFAAKAGETYFLTMKFDNYVNVRGVYMRQVVQTGKSYEELQEMMAQAEDVYAQYQEGTDGYYAIGGDLSLVALLEDALAVASELAEDNSSEEITAAYYALEDAIGKILAAPVVNVVPNDDANLFDISNGEFTHWRMENGGNIGYAYGNGLVEYTVYNKLDCKYDIAFTCSNQAMDMSQIGARIDVITADDDTITVAEQVVDVTGAGGWALWDDPNANYTFTGIPVPAGRVLFTVYGVAAASNGFVGNMNKFHFTPIEGTEGEGQKALAEDIDVVTVGAAADGEVSVYTIDGKYIGNNTSLLREGIYIVNGKKIVIK